MKKIMLAFVLAIASSVWTMSEAICITQRLSFPGDDSWYGGTLQLVGMPCEEGEVCPPCLTVALMMYGHTYYLAGDERMNSLQAQLDTIEYPAKALINGVYYKQGSFDYIYVGQLFLNPENQYRLPSLCDTWNVLMDNRFTLGSAEGRCWTDRFKLQGDTIINNTKYAQMLYADGLYTYAQLQWNYYGSIRETENAEIYFIPAGQNKEYLLYAFNAKVGDIFKNLYGMIEGNDVWAEVKEVTEKEIVLELKGRYEDVEYTYFENYVWIKGVGANLALFQPLPSGTEGGPIINNLLCAYRNDELVYTSEYGEKYGCNYFGHTKQEIIDQLVGNWLLYKEDITGIYWDEQGNPINGTRSHEFNKDDYGFTFTEGTVVQFCPNYCSSTPFTYTLDDYGYKDWLLTIPGRFDTSQPSDPSISGFSPIIIHKLTYEEMELEYYVYGGDEGPYIHYQYLRKAPSQLPSLCDTWNVLENNKIYKYHLTTDTIIAGTRYVKLFKDNAYEGALREGDNRDIYCIPANKTHEYLLYAFNAQVRETLTNGWLVGRSVNYGDEYWFIISEILETSPRIFVFYITPPGGGASGITGRWIEGVGAEYGPICNSGEGVLLCAYKKGELVYTSETGKEYGCYYDGGTQQDRLPSLCDEWNVLMDSGFELGPVYGEIWTNGFKVQGDTIINNIIYSRLLFADGHQKKQRESREWVYYGALREAANAEIYFIPAGQNKEYLLYAFNAQVGDRIENLLTDDYRERNVWAIVKEVSENEIILDFYEQLDDREDVVLHNYTWVKGIGSKRSMFQPIPIYSGGGVVNFLLCAYNDEKHIYTSEFGEKYGCYYDGGTQQAMFTSDTRWHYRHSEYGGPDANYNFTLHPVDTIINNTHYLQIGWNLFRSEGAKVWCAIDSMGTLVERLVYDFDLQVGDSIRKLFYNEEIMSIYNEEIRSEQDYEFPRYYAKVTKVEKITLADGRLARRLSYDDRPDDIEHIGSVEGILASLNFAISTCGCSDYFQCCTCGDELLYEVETGACDTFFIKDDTPRDTIPLYKDGPGSSTVQPVDPNEIVATLQHDVLSIFEHIGKEIGYKLTQTSSSSNAPAGKRLVKSDTFHESVAVTLTESGTYMLELTHPDWDYTIVGTFEYMGGENAVINTEATEPSARKIMRDGQLLIRKGEKIYTLTGVQIQ